MSSPLGQTRPLIEPIYQSSVYTIPDLDTLDRIYGGEEPGFIYARDAHPNAMTLARDFARIESGKWGIICASGMASLSVAFLGMVSAGDRVIASNRLYGRTTKLLKQELGRLGVVTDLVDCSDLGEVREALKSPAKCLIAETMSNPMLRLIDIPALSSMCHEKGCKVIIDNTFATPVLCRPLEQGADIVMESLTKVIGGHGDITLGAIAGNDMALYPSLVQITSIWGLSSNPMDCWLTQRSLPTLEMRMSSATANALEIAFWLTTQPGVARVVYPALPEHPDHELARRLFPLGCGNMLCFELAGDGRAAVNHFLRQPGSVPFSPSLGHFDTTCSHPATTSHRYESAEEKQKQGITDGLLRLSVGCEPVTDIRAKLARGLLQS